MKMKIAGSMVNQYNEHEYLIMLQTEAEEGVMVAQMWGLSRQSDTAINTLNSPMVRPLIEQELLKVSTLGKIHYTLGDICLTEGYQFPVVTVKATDDAGQALSFSTEGTLTNQQQVCDAVELALRNAGLTHAPSLEPEALKQEEPVSCRTRNARRSATRP